MKSFFIQALFLNLISPILLLRFDVQELSYNQLIEETIQNPEMKFYSLKLDDLIEGKDLIVDAKISDEKKDVLDSPLVLVSLKPLPNTDKKSQWICGQLGQETCFIPNKYLHPGDVIYVGAFCEECSYSLRVFYLKEEILKDGEPKLFHLKAGDKKLFKLDEFFLGEKEMMQISSFNMRMTKYSMSVQISEMTNSKNQIISVPVQMNWIGGQQAVIRPKTVGYSTKFEYLIVVEAQENGVFTIEARTSGGVSILDDKILKFEVIRQGQKQCFSYDIPKSSLGNDLRIEAKSIKGEIELSFMPKSRVEPVAKIIVKDGKEAEKKTLTSYERAQGGYESKEWLICAQTNAASAYYTLQVYMENNVVQVKEYKKLLYRVLKSEEMYDLDNLQIKHPELRKIENIPQFRILAQERATEEDTSNPTANNSTTTINPKNVVEVNGETIGGNEIHINGTGVAGIATGFIFLIPVLIGCYILMSIFVNTKLVDQPLKLGKID